MIVVIADDITGAAELAGIALTHGLRVSLHASSSKGEIGACDDAEVVVIATDCRSYSQEEAVGCMEGVLEALKGFGADVVYFKKTDSALRGHIVAELDVMMRKLSISRTLLLPQNPSKGRIVQQGVYSIHGVPLAETAFSYDPEFPAHHSSVEKILPGIKSVAIGEALYEGISLGDAVSVSDVVMHLSHLPEKTLLAGAADLFEAYLSQRYGKTNVDTASFDVRSAGKTLVVCGSTQSRSLKNEVPFAHRDTVERSMPLSVYQGESSLDWIESLVSDYTAHECLILQVGHPSSGGKEQAVYIRTLFATIVARLTSLQAPSLLIIEGGATAFAILSALGWQALSVCQELAPGVVVLAHENTHIMLKPGSYGWAF